MPLGLDAVKKQLSMPSLSFQVTNAINEGRRRAPPSATATTADVDNFGQIKNLLSRIADASGTALSMDQMSAATESNGGPLTGGQFSGHLKSRLTELERMRRLGVPEVFANPMLGKRNQRTNVRGNVLAPAQKRQLTAEEQLAHISGALSKLTDVLTEQKNKTQDVAMAAEEEEQAAAAVGQQQQQQEQHQREEAQLERDRELPQEEEEKVVQETHFQQNPGAIGVKKRHDERKRQEERQMQEQNPNIGSFTGHVLVSAKEQQEKGKTHQQQQQQQKKR